MADDFNFKKIKPTMSQPSSMGKKIDSGFNKQMRNAGVNMKTIQENDLANINEKEESLKKKIFNLAKMETLVATDEYLNNIFNKLKPDASELYGYHWNETLHNIIFNDHVLNDAGYLQKYKNTQTIEKKRRGQEGSEELEKKVQDKVDDLKGDGEAPVLKRDKISNVNKGDKSVDQAKKELSTDENDVASKMKQMSEEADVELNELFGFGKPAPLNTHKASKNDTYFIDKGSKTAVGVISQNIPAEQNAQTAQKFADSMKYDRMPWYVAVKNGVKGIPAEVTDGSMNDFASAETKYSGVQAMAETTAAASSGQFTAPLGKTDEPVADTTYTNETTTSASSGAFVGPFPKKRKSVLDTPAWKGGTVIAESTDYLTDPKSFAKYVRLVENVKLVESLIAAPMGEAVSMKQHAENILKQLQRMAQENNELAELPEFQQIVKHYATKVTQPEVQPQPQQQPQGQLKVEGNYQDQMRDEVEHMTGNNPGNVSTKEIENKNDFFKHENMEQQNNTQGSQQQPQPNAGGDVFLKLGKALFPGLGNDQDLANLAKGWYQDFSHELHGKSPEDILSAVEKAYGSPQNAPVAETSMLDDNPTSMVANSPTSMANTMDSPELNVSGAPTDATQPPTQQPVTESTIKTKNMNEERMTPSMLNLEKVKKETAALAKKDLVNKDALKQAEVYPNPDEFYIEQDDAKVQDFKTAEQLEKEALAKTNDNNVGNSTNDNGKELQKRNLSKEEMTKLAMDRGDGMHNIVYDNKPSEKFEDRLKKDMGDEQYKLRQDKMDYRKDMPMYNKDTQPTDNGNNVEQDNKFKNGFNESFTGKYQDELGRTKLVEFVLADTQEVTSSEGFKLNLEGLGNKYTQKINESKNFADVVNQYDFYLVENTVVKVNKATGEAPKGVINENFKKMEHLMGYKASEYVNTKKSVKF